MHRSLKRKLVLGATVIAAAAFAGGAYAASGDSTPNARQAFLADVAKRLGVPEQKLDQALRAAFTDQLQQAVKAGKLTQAQANQIEQRAKDGRIPLFGLVAPRLLGPLAPPLLGPNSRLEPRPLLPGGGTFSAAAGYLGLSDIQLLSQLRSGKSLAQIAGAQHKSVSGLEDAMVANLQAKLEKAVAAEELTSVQEQRLLARMKAVLGAQINRAWPGPGFAPHQHRGFAPDMAPPGRFAPGAVPAQPPPGPGTPY